jgi:hypothetical protein
MPIINLHQTPCYLVSSPYWQMDEYYVYDVYSGEGSHATVVGKEARKAGKTNMIHEAVGPVYACPLWDGQLFSNGYKGQISNEGYKIVFYWKDTTAGSVWVGRGITSLKFDISWRNDFRSKRNYQESNWLAADGTKNLPTGVSVSVVMTCPDNGNTEQDPRIGNIYDGGRKVTATVRFSK